MNDLPPDDIFIVSPERERERRQARLEWLRREFDKALSATMRSYAVYSSTARRRRVIEAMLAYYDPTSTPTPMNESAYVMALLAYGDLEHGITDSVFRSAGGKGNRGLSVREQLARTTAYALQTLLYLKGGGFRADWKIRDQVIAVWNDCHMPWALEHGDLTRHPDWLDEARRHFDTPRGDAGRAMILLYEGLVERWKQTPERDILDAISKFLRWLTLVDH